MKLSVKFFQMKFSNESKKEAYLECCMWLARNVVGKIKVEMGEVMHNISIDKDADLPTFILELYSTIEDEPHVKMSCDVCKEFHTAFYINQQFNCDACNMTAYRHKMNDKLKTLKAYRRNNYPY